MAMFNGSNYQVSATEFLLQVVSGQLGERWSD